MDVDLGRGIRPPVMGGETHHPRLANNHLLGIGGTTLVAQALPRLQFSSLGLRQICTFGTILGGIAAVF